MEVNRDLIEPLKRFAKDSVHLVKKCTKPDRKGQCGRSLAACAAFPDETPRPCGCHRITQIAIADDPRTPPPVALGALRRDPASCRVHAHRARDFGRLPDHGFHRFLRQACPHPDQQHHCRRCLESPRSARVPPIEGGTQQLHGARISAARVLLTRRRVAAGGCTDPFHHFF